MERYVSDNCLITHLPLKKNEECIMVVLNNDGKFNYYDLFYGHTFDRMIKHISTGFYDGCGWILNLPKNKEKEIFYSCFFLKSAWIHALQKITIEDEKELRNKIMNNNPLCELNFYNSCKHKIQYTSDVYDLFFSTIEFDLIKVCYYFFKMSINLSLDSNFKDVNKFDYDTYEEYLGFCKNMSQNRKL